MINSIIFVSPLCSAEYSTITVFAEVIHDRELRNVVVVLT